MLDKLNLEGKTIVVTGGGSGLGKAMSLALAEAGADVVVAARRQNLIDETASEIQNIGRRSLAIATDVTDSKQIENLFSIVRKELKSENYDDECWLKAFKKADGDEQKAKAFYIDFRTNDLKKQTEKEKIADNLKNNNYVQCGKPFCANS